MQFSFPAKLALQKVARELRAKIFRANPRASAATRVRASSVHSVAVAVAAIADVIIAEAVPIAVAATVALLAEDLNAVRAAVRAPTAVITPVIPVPRAVLS